jgi:calcineurin-like phosphoesterase family protein
MIVSEQRMKGPHHFSRVVEVVLILSVGLSLKVTTGLAAAGYSSALRRYPYLTDVVNSYATINWATDRTNSSGAVRWGKVGSESCTAHYTSASRVSLTVNGVPEYQWKALLDLAPGTQYCYRVYLGSSPANEVDLLGTDSSPSFWTQMPSGSNQAYSFVVFGDWGYVGTAGTNPYQASLMSLIAASGARFAVTTGDNGYPSGSQSNFGDLIQTGSNLSAIFGPLFWKVPGASIPIFPASGNHGLSNSDAVHPLLLNFPQDRAVATSGGRYIKETYCCLNGTTSANYPSAWYAFDAGPVRIYILNAAWSDSNIGTTTAYKVDYDYHWAPGTPQYQWLVADLAAHPSLLKFAVWHYPLYTDDPNERTDTYLQGASSLEGLLHQYGVNLAFTGHSHTYERNFASPVGLPNYVTGGGGATPGTLGTCTALDAYAIKFTTSGKACGSASAPTSAGQIYHFLLVTVDGSRVRVAPTNSLGQTFDVIDYNFTTGVETTPPSVPTNLTATVASGTRIDLGWTASSDNTGVRGYSVYRNGALIGTTDAATLTYSDTKLIPNANYVYSVDAFDRSGNHSTPSVSSLATTANTASYTFAPVADSYVAGDVTGTNYGTSATLKVDGSPDYRSYLRFNVNEIQGTVTQATLRLYSTSSSATGYRVGSVISNTWDEAQLTYANAPALGLVVSSSGNFSSGNWVSVNVTSLVTGNGVYDLGLSTTSTSSINFNSRDAASNVPQLVIQTLSDSAPPATITNTPITATVTRTPTATNTAAGIAPSNTPTYTTTPTTTPASTTVLTFTPSDDAYVQSDLPTTNFGSDSRIVVDNSPVKNMLLKFTVSGIGTGNIVSARLRLYCVDPSPFGGNFRRVADTTWSQENVNWNTAPAADASSLATLGAVAAGNWYEVDVTSLVTGDGTFSLRTISTSSDGAYYSSKEGTAGFAPQLVITLSASGDIPTSTRTPTPIPVTPTSTSLVIITNTPTATATPFVPPTTSATPTLTSTANTFTYTPVADTYVQSDTPTSNYGSSAQFVTDNSPIRNMLMKFNVSGMGTQTVVSAKLRIYCVDSSPFGGEFHGVADTAWSETGVNWNNAPVASPNILATLGRVSAGNWYEVDVTSLITGDGIYSLKINSTSSDGAYYSTREGTAGFAPQLIIITAPGTSTPTP